VPALTKYYREPWEVNKRLKELGLDLDKLLQVRRIARDAYLRATPDFPANAAGTFSYQYGSWALRDQCVDQDWQLDRCGGVEAIRHDGLGIRVAFCNVDVACHENPTPKPRTDKGAGAERLSQQVFPGMPVYSSAPVVELLYYFMLDIEGRAELTLPKIQAGKFVGFVERIYLSEGDDESIDRLPVGDSDIADGFDPVVARKK
jgi:hypothetical protein